MMDPFMNIFLNYTPGLHGLGYYLVLGTTFSWVLPGLWYYLVFGTTWSWVLPDLGYYLVLGTTWSWVLPGLGNKAAGRFLILSYFYCISILICDQVAGTYGVTRLQVADSRRAYGYVYMSAHVYTVHVYVYVYIYIDTCVHVYVHV